MKQVTRGLCALAMALCLSGCGMGLIYTHTVQPLTLDLHRTKVASSSAEGDIKYIRIPYFGIAWDSAAIGDIAKRYGLTELYSADLETLTVLYVWNRYTLHVYGR